MEKTIAGLEKLMVDMKEFQSNDNGHSTVITAEFLFPVLIELIEEVKTLKEQIKTRV